MNKIKVSAVSYLNTKPLLYGLFNHPVNDQITLQLDVPSECARKLAMDEVDLALMPVGALSDFKDWHLISDYCIGADGKVRTVCVYSQVPIEEITDVYLDTDSRTSVLLCRYLFEHFWKKAVNFNQNKGEEVRVEGTHAALLIGDKALDQEQHTAYIYDLAKSWKDMHGLPFAFAVWVSKKALPPLFIQQFNEALQQGIDHIDQLVQLIANTRPHFDVFTYYKDNISFKLDAAKKQSLALFLEVIKPYQQLK
ncbi:MAG TPA: menaquinone biosynthesis protein [Saprospiraceae bacterium]|nr:menaquinone biosynthesis protein [Saprospiraceae bacterium]HQW56087.1 menaquinone biosynthesis protein [Saprospiraceae bacterium]